MSLENTTCVCGSFENTMCVCDSLEKHSACECACMHAGLCLLLALESLTHMGDNAEGREPPQREVKTHSETITSEENEAKRLR